MRVSIQHQSDISEQFNPHWPAIMNKSANISVYYLRSVACWDCPYLNTYSFLWRSFVVVVLVMGPPGRATATPRSAQWRTGGALVLGLLATTAAWTSAAGRRRARQAIAWLCGGVTESRKWLRVDRSREPTLGTVLETPDAMPDFRWLDQNWTVGKKLLTWFNEVLRLGPSLEI